MVMTWFVCLLCTTLWKDYATETKIEPWLPGLASHCGYQMRLQMTPYGGGTPNFSHRCHSFWLTN